MEAAKESARIDVSVAPAARPFLTSTDRDLRRDVWRGLAAGFLILLLLLICFACFVSSMPHLTAADWAALKHFPPTSIQQLVAMRNVILTYAVDYPEFVLAGFCMLYVLMMTFAVPGTLSLSLLAGALYGVRCGLLLVAVVSTIGAASCYVMSWLVGRAVVRLVWAEKLEEYALEVRARRSDMFSYIVLLRVMPILPNTFINVASPIVDVPLGVFSIGTFFGCMPNNLVAVKAGSKLGELRSLRDLYDPPMIILMAVVAGIAVASIYYKRHVKRVDREE